jgi:hypothetical protein
MRLRPFVYGTKTRGLFMIEALSIPKRASGLPPIASAANEQTLKVADELAAKGYQVTIEPSPDNLPFDLSGYCPDLVAFKDGGGIILEMKPRLAGVSVDRFQQLAERVAQHAGWRFMLVTLDDVTKNILPEGQEDLPSWSALKDKVAGIDGLIGTGLLEPALLYLWGAIEAMLRKRALAQLLPIDRFPADKLLKHSYSSGELSIQEFDLITPLLAKRNRVAHGLVTVLVAEELRQLLDVTCGLLDKWSTD